MPFFFVWWAACLAAFLRVDTQTDDRNVVEMEDYRHDPRHRAIGR